MSEPGFAGDSPMLQRFAQMSSGVQGGHSMRESSPEAGARLRELLDSFRQYQLDDGSVYRGTLRQVFAMLYGDWAIERYQWTQAQNGQRERLRLLHPDGADDAYLEWYRENAPASLAALQAKYAKMCSIFSPGDLEIVKDLVDELDGAHT